MIKSSVIIVENSKGDVFIVEDKEEKSQIDKILNSDVDKKSFQADNESELQDIEEEDIIEEYLDEYLDEIKSESSVYNVYADHQYTSITVEENMEGEESNDDSINYEDTFESEIKTNNNSKKQHHKFHQLTGKAACKYCETVFKSKESLKQHNCKYLECDPKNFICRICNKELSKKTFSNHLHEGILDCQYCSKSFVNPRNLKTHIKKIHKNEKFIPPKSPNRTFIKELKVEDNADVALLDDQTGFITSKTEEENECIKKKKYVKKVGRFECEFCARIFSFARSLTTHLLLHTKDYRFVCEICGEKFTTKTGIAKHSCLNRKRKRPEKDFRTVDVRHCKYCDLWFSSFEENRNHICKFQPSTSDQKNFVCRFCMIEMSKNSFNKHMSRHLNPKEYVCKLCDKKLACEKALITHLTTHSGNRPFSCNYCDKSFINKTLLIRHSRFHGVQVQQFKCTVCDKEMASKYHLKTHMQLHSEFQICKICKERFPTREKLKEHYHSSHEPFRCSICSKTFVLARYLKMHEKLHTGDTTKHYNCIYCHKQFSKRALANHVFSLHHEYFNEWKDKNMEFIIS
ncbi:unnamed protein product [Chironomus riparius]|uniref:C2H2-type domain-containing protein n=1 Tax=Chironomus riparius TaxID=315576 RepID=A0A9N9RLI7_9DIPT|nr:unnamed protein product [Chironomus riparius]